MGAEMNDTNGRGRFTRDETISPILDGAAAQPILLPRELEAERRIASDLAASLEDRLEAFENIIDSEIGDTGLSRARNIERETGLRQLYLKFDGGNPTGTQKDRIAFAQAMDALRRGIRHDDRGDLWQLRRRSGLGGLLRRSAVCDLRARRRYHSSQADGGDAPNTAPRSS